MTSFPLSSGKDGSSPRLRWPRRHDASLEPRVATHLLLANSSADLRRRPDAAAGLHHLDISEAARRTLDPGVTWFGWRVPSLVEVGIVNR